jgi:hypothetical protein
MRRCLSLDYLSVATCYTTLQLRHVRAQNDHTSTLRVCNARVHTSDERCGSSPHRVGHSIFSESRRQTSPRCRANPRSLHAARARRDCRFPTGASGGRGSGQERRPKLTPRRCPRQPLCHARRTSTAARRRTRTLPVKVRDPSPRSHRSPGKDSSNCPASIRTAGDSHKTLDRSGGCRFHRARVCRGTRSGRNRGSRESSATRSHTPVG